MKREAKHTVKWNHYLKETGIQGYFELKQTRTDNFSYKNFEKHQLDSLTALRHTGLVWKFSDQDQREKPCDVISAPSMPAYIVIKYPKAFVAIAIERLVLEKFLFVKGSLNYKQARDIAAYILED